MALKTDFKDDIFEGNRKYKLSQDGEGNTEIQDVTVYSQEGNLFTAEHINATNKAVNGLSEDMASLKKSVSDGKTLVAAAITAKKVATAATASFAEMAENIKKIVLGSGTARAADVLAGKTFTNNDGVEYTGTMPERGTWNGSLGTSGSITIPAGHHSGQGKVSAATQTALTLNPGTTQKTAYVYQKYMLGNITVPAINIPAAYIKKGQRITFPDGSSVVGTFEGWVPVATDIYYRGTIGFGGSFVRIIDQTRVDGYLTADKIYWSAYKYSRNIAFATANAVDVHKYSKIIIEGSGLSTVKFSVTGGRYSESSSGRDKWYFQDVALSNTGGTFSLTAGASHQLGIYLKLPSDCPEGYITRIRLE
jgi:hypothetical protein